MPSVKTGMHAWAACPQMDSISSRQAHEANSERYTTIKSTARLNLILHTDIIRRGEIKTKTKPIM
jgi:hypothetical protein